MKPNILSVILILGSQISRGSSQGITNPIEVTDDFNLEVKRSKRETGCGKTVKLDRGKSVSFSSTESKSTKDECHWSFLGDTGCTPEIKCDTLNLAKTNEDCTGEFLKISDGIQGEMSVCGKVKFDKPLVASGGGRDLFAHYKPAKNHNGQKTFSCTASCTARKDKGLPLPHVPRREDSRCVCGLQNNDNRIVGGEDSKMNEFPWQAAIVFAGTRSPKCGASIINDRWVLTATHCFFFEGVKASEIEVLTHAFVLDMTKKDDAADVPLGQMGSIRGSGYNKKAYTDADEDTKRYKIAEIVMHPLFTESYDYDFALLRLEKKIDFSDPSAPTPVCLPTESSFNLTFEGTNPLVVGWGMPDENAGGTTRVLQKLAVPVIPMSKCQAWMPGLVTQRMICAGYELGKKDACTGDSGGPLILQQNSKQWWQIGIVSWGEGCAQKHKPGLYSRVTEMQQWITYHASQQGAKWCRDTKGNEGKGRTVVEPTHPHKYLVGNFGRSANQNGNNGPDIQLYK